jgi:peptidoglycan/xylan/chitin deacetylase (PgdA/CDA1 family)
MPSRPRLALALALAAAVGAAARAQAAVTVVFRFDDPSARTDLKVETAVLDAFRAHHWPVTFGVVPFVSGGDLEDPAPQTGYVLPPAKTKLFRRALSEGTLDVAQHGWSHQNSRKGEYDAEFEGLPEAEQHRRIADGKAKLEAALGVPIKAFIPPWNGYDLATVKVLEDLEYELFSASLRGPAPGRSSLHWLPSTSSLEGLRAAVDAARDSGDPDAAVVVLFHAFEITLPQLKEELDWLAAQPNVRVVSLSRASELVPGLGADRFRANRQGLLWDLTPFRLRPRLRRLYIGAYLSDGAAWKAKGVWAVALAASYGALFLSALLGFGTVWEAESENAGLLVSLGAAGLAWTAAVLLLTLGGGLQGRKAAAAAVLFGAGAAPLLSAYRRRDDV